MTTLELSNHPELGMLLAELRKGESVALTYHGTVLGEVFPVRLGRDMWKSRLLALHDSFVSSVYAGKSVVDMRSESR